MLLFLQRLCLFGVLQRWCLFQLLFSYRDDVYLRLYCSYRDDVYLGLYCSFRDDVYLGCYCSYKDVYLGCYCSHKYVYLACYFSYRDNVYLRCHISYRDDVYPGCYCSYSDDVYLGFSFWYRDNVNLGCYVSYKDVACALVTSHLDYCNSLLYNLPNRDIKRLQRVQNCLRRVVCKASRFSWSKPLLNFLHWLPVPVKYRIRFKLCTITLKPSFFTNLHISLIM